MSELKVYHCNEWHNEYTEFYIKSEADKVIARHKYKRCLAMAKWCRVSAQYDMRLLAYKYSDWYWKWYKRWLSIAENFKPNPTINRKGGPNALQR